MTRVTETAPNVAVPNQRPAPSEPIADGAARGAPGLAGSGRRLAGALIDFAVILLLTGALWVRLIIAMTDGLDDAVAVFLIELTATILLAVGYHWVLTANWDTTIGKRCVGAYVVSATDGSRIGSGPALVRAVLLVLTGWATAVFGLRRGRRQCLHDKVAGTVVVRTRPLWAPARQAGLRSQTERDVRGHAVRSGVRVMPPAT